MSEEDHPREIETVRSLFRAHENGEVGNLTAALVAFDRLARVVEAARWVALEDGETAAFEQLRIAVGGLDIGPG